MPAFAWERVQSRQAMAGLFVLHDRFPVGQAIADLLLIIACSTQPEWVGRVVYLPL
jgi:hypothetical protein